MNSKENDIRIYFAPNFVPLDIEKLKSAVYEICGSKLSIRKHNDVFYPGTIIELFGIDIIFGMDDYVRYRLQAHLHGIIPEFDLAKRIVDIANKELESE